MRQIPPIPLKDKYWLDIQKEIERIFNEVLFIPLIQSIDNLGNLPDRFEKTIKWLDGDFNKALKAITILRKKK